MSTITQSQAIEFEQRLIALERKVGMERLANTTTTSLDDRLSKVKADLNGKLSQSNSKISNVSNQESWKMIQKLLKELDPGIALTHQQQPLLYKRQQVLACSDELQQDFGELESLLKLLLSGTKVDGVESGISSDPKSTGATKTKTKTSTGSTTTSGSSSKTHTKQEQLQQQAKEKAEEKILQQQQQQMDGSSRNSNETLRLDQVTQAPLLTQFYSNCGTPAEQKRVQDLAQKLTDLNARTQALTQQLGKYLECYHTTAMAVSEKIVLADEKISSTHVRR